MNRIVLDAARWQTALDFLTALKTALRAPDWHGNSPDAFVDSMICGGINAVDPPYVIEIVGLDPTNRDLCACVTLLASVIAEARSDRLEEGIDVQAEIVVAPPRATASP